MSQVYTFSKKNVSKTSTTTNLTPSNLSTNSYKPQNTGGQGAYSFKREDTEKPLTFTEEDFPSLGSGKTAVVTEITSKNIGSWANASKSAVIREPFPEKVAVPKTNIPPLFSKVKKSKKVIYEDDEEEEDELYADYDESDQESGPGFRNPDYENYEDEEF